MMKIPITTIETCDSTMNEAAKMFSSSSPSSSLPFAIRAITQTRSRGTGGRKWISSPGNLHLTIALPMPFSHIINNITTTSTSQNNTNIIIISKKQPLALSPKTQVLFPCILGIALFNALNKIVSSCNKNPLKNDHDDQQQRQPPPEDFSSSPLVLKWPNDVLIRKTGQKICGNLIECAYNKETKQQALLVGIGVNVTSSVLVEDGGRKPGTLMEVIESNISSSSSSIGDKNIVDDRINAELVGEEICSELVNSVTYFLTASFEGGDTTDKRIVEAFGKRLDWSTHIYLRKKMPNETIDSDTVVEGGVVRTERGDEPFKPVRLNEFGGLIVKSEIDGREVELSSDYLF